MSALTEEINEATSPGVVESGPLAAALQDLLSDLAALRVQAKQAHWNLVGYDFPHLRLQLDDTVTLARDFSDAIAERMRAFGAIPDNRAPTRAATAQLTPLPSTPAAISETVDLVAHVRDTSIKVRNIQDRIKADRLSSDLFSDVIDQLEKQAWMLSAETGIAQRSRR
ncbi:MAG TPA: DNA starvation/stationary phase protection protein [Acidimicrobiales bacterium]|nr:DNA starvation/stationary phase protection protein [Acidimicrobiales bacterium]